MNVRRSLALVAPIALGALVATAHAAPPPKAPKPLVVPDATGDAGGVEARTDPLSLDEYDIKSLTIAATGSMASRRVGRRTVRYFNCTGFTAAIELAGAPSTTASLYRVQSATQKLDQFWLEYRNPAGGATSTKLRYTDPGSVTGTSSIDLKTPAKVLESKVIFTVTQGDLKAVGESIGKTILSDILVDTRSHLNAVTVPMWDTVEADEAAAWKVCPV